MVRSGSPAITGCSATPATAKAGLWPSSRTTCRYKSLPSLLAATARPGLSRPTGGFCYYSVGQNTVTPDQVARFMVSTSGSVTAGTAAAVTVAAQDASGNVIADYTGSVQFSSSDQQAGLPANYTFSAADLGSHTFSIVLKTSGSQAITATAGSVSGQAAVQVAAAAATNFVVSAPAGRPQARAPGHDHSQGCFWQHRHGLHRRCDPDQQRPASGIARQLHVRRPPTWAAIRSLLSSNRPAHRPSPVPPARSAARPLSRSAPPRPRTSLSVHRPRQPPARASRSRSQPRMLLATPSRVTPAL